MPPTSYGVYENNGSTVKPCTWASPLCASNPLVIYRNSGLGGEHIKLITIAVVCESILSSHVKIATLHLCAWPGHHTSPLKC